MSTSTHLPFGRGEMAELIRTKDWSTSPLGDPSTWPQSLRTALSICLSSRFPMIIWWGPELCVLYNDAYIPIFGKKHPWVLGRSGTEAWGEVWDVIGPMLEGVMQRGEASWSNDGLLVLERFGYREETYFTWSYSPIADEHGRVGGAFTAVSETTSRVLAERRLRTIRELAEQVADAKTVAEAFQMSASTLAKNAADVPSSIFYRLADDGQTAERQSLTGIPPTHPAAPRHVTLNSPPESWPFERVVMEGAVTVDDLAHRFAEIPGTHWPEPTASARVLPLVHAGQQRPYGFIVAGINPRRQLDDDYKTFFDLLAGHIASAVANAQQFQEERRRLEALAELDRAKTTFFSNVSHEFRTPLTLMLGPTEDAIKSPERTLTGDNLESVYRNELRLLKLVNTLLDFARIEAGRARASYEATDLAALTLVLTSAFRAAVERAGLRFVVDCAPLSEPIFVDRDMWEKIVLNLLSNALKFTFEGEITVALCIEANEAVLTVRDTGAGIPADELPHLFQRFHRVQGARSRTHEGSGIGLALVQELVKMHGGSIAVDSTLGNGTGFVVRIPTGSAHLPNDQIGTKSTLTSTALGAAPYVQEALRWLPATEPRSEGAAERGNLNRSKHPSRIVVADDNADLRDYVARLLAEHWTVEAVANGRAALEAARRHRPNLIVSDVMMPELDGIGLVRELRRDPDLAAVPVILLSARAGEEASAEGISVGANDYLVKPFSSRELIARVAAQLEIARAQRLIEESAENERRRLYRVFMEAPAAIAVLRGPTHVYELANERYYAISGARDIIGKPLREALPELAAQGIADLLDRVFATGEPYIANEFPADIDRTESGRLERGYYNFVLQPTRDKQGRIDGIVAFVIDVTKQVLARQQVDAAREREAHLRDAAEAANRAKDEFLAMLGHELRNPLAPIMTALHLMHLRGDGRDERERTIIKRQVVHLTQLVDDLLDVSRITRGKIELKKRCVEMAEIVAKAIEMVSPLIEQRQHHVSLSVPREGAAVDGDPTRLAQIVANLVNNAAKYTEAGGHISINVRRDGDRVVLHVIDNGIGIDPEMMPRIFDLFIQERQALDRSQGGLGLGLAIVRSLATMHGGTIQAHSEGRGRGSEFILSLPASTTQRATLEHEPTHRTTAAKPIDRRILVVDDNEDAADLLVELVTALGYAAVAAHDGPSALRLAQEFKPDLALLDIGLPVMDGYEVATRLREDAETRGLRLVAVTGYGQESDVERSRCVGFDAHLVKPIDPTRVDDILRRLLEKPVARSIAAE